MIRAAVAGAAGRMGRRLIALLHESGEFRVVGAALRSGDSRVGRDAGDVAGIGPIRVALTDRIDQALDAADVLIDFSAPAAAVRHVEAASRARVAMVLGTTGLAEADLRRLPTLCADIACGQSFNMSVGLAAISGVLAEMARALGGGYDIEIIETHHRFKKDAPSGTALHIATLLAQALARDLPQVALYGRHGMVGERPPQAIGLHAVRAGDIVGEHRILFGGMGESIEIVHRAQSRDHFVHAALRAAKWVVGRPPGLYGFMDVLAGEPKDGAGPHSTRRWHAAALGHREANDGQ